MFQASGLDYRRSIERDASPCKNHRNAGISIRRQRLLASNPLEAESLLEGGVDGVGGNVARAALVGAVADLESRDDVEDGVGSARGNDGGGKIELVTVNVVGTRDGSRECGAGVGLLQLSLEVVVGGLSGGNLAIQLIISTVVDGSNTEGEATRHADTEGDSAVLAGLRDGNTGTGLSVEVTEGDSNGTLVGAQDVVSASSRAARSVNTNARDVESSGARGTLIQIDGVGSDADNSGGESKESGEELDHCEREEELGVSSNPTKLDGDERRSPCVLLSLRSTCQVTPEV